MTIFHVIVVHSLFERLLNISTIANVTHKCRTLRIARFRFGQSICSHFCCVISLEKWMNWNKIAHILIKSHHIKLGISKTNKFYVGNYEIENRILYQSHFALYDNLHLCTFSFNGVLIVFPLFYCNFLRHWALKLPSFQNAHIHENWFLSTPFDFPIFINFPSVFCVLLPFFCLGTFNSIAVRRNWDIKWALNGGANAKTTTHIKSTYRIVKTITVQIPLYWQRYFPFRLYFVFFLLSHSLVPILFDEIFQCDFQMSFADNLQPWTKGWENWFECEN